jgi:hypothetical protein
MLHKIAIALAAASLFGAAAIPTDALAFGRGGGGGFHGHGGGFHGGGFGGFRGGRFGGGFRGHGFGPGIGLGLGLGLGLGYGAYYYGNRCYASTPCGYQWGCGYPYPYY